MYNLQIKKFCLKPEDVFNNWRQIYTTDHKKWKKMSDLVPLQTRVYFDLCRAVKIASSKRFLCIVLDFYINVCNFFITLIVNYPQFPVLHHLYIIKHLLSRMTFLIIQKIISNYSSCLFICLCFINSSLSSPLLFLASKFTKTPI